MTLPDKPITGQGLEPAGQFSFCNCVQKLQRYIAVIEARHGRKMRAARFLKVFLKRNANLFQGFHWIGPVDPGTEDYNFGPGEKPGVD